MNRSNRLTLVLAVLLIISFTLLAVSALSVAKANANLERILNIQPQVVTVPAVSANSEIDDQIMDAQEKLRAASSRIHTRKVEIGIHARRAVRTIDRQGENSILEARRLMTEIADNTKLLIERNEEIEAETLRLYGLYQRKIETILAAQEAQKEVKLGLEFWAGLLGMLATVSGIVLAWRNDKLEHQKERREFMKFQKEDGDG